MGLIVKNSDQEKWMFGDCGIAFDGAGSWNLGNDFARNARNTVVFGVDNSLLSHTDNQKNNFLVIGEGPTDDLILIISQLIIV